MSVCGMRREGLSWIALGGWFFFGGGDWGAYPYDVVDYLAPSALTAGHFFSWKKVTKNRLLHHTALRCATGSLAPVLLREDRAVRPLLGLSAFRPSMASTSLRKTSTRPPEVAGRSRARSRSTARATAGESLRSRFVYLPAKLWCGWQAAPCDLHWQYRPLRGASPLLQGLRRFWIRRNPCRSGLAPRRGPNIHHPCHYQKQSQPRRHP
ncbi:hypothetical protein J2W83_001697 [Pseudomonas hunanensis]|uniref:Uncharacterized protein n=1 Tax=Pseudomonas hunanensis TaxID=1247546 RepID=A0ACC6K0Y4_9PSED|nr:hypothetical protein [Pseudomonas hunanensis]